jgi:hypothetical protein
MNECLSNESGNTSVEAIVVRSFFVFDFFPQSFECGYRKIGGRFKSALIHGAVNESTGQSPSTQETKITPPSDWLEACG